ncbi:hypothetical protein B566_EDAN012134 [Ephemera danica]|nr:hypothetical protein B566_EDAN012134 [Ephemera danica]
MSRSTINGRTQRKCPAVRILVPPHVAKTSQASYEKNVEADSAAYSHLSPVLEQWAQGRAGYVTINGREYYMDDVTRRDWSQATDYCTALGMALVSLETQTENDAIYLSILHRSR